MSQIRVFGDRLPPGSVGPRQVPSLPASKTAQPPIQVRRWVRNETHPNAEYESLKNEALNQAAVFRTKDYANFCAHLKGGANATPPDRWRFAFRSGPLAHAAYCRMLLASPGSGATNAMGALKLFTAADESVLASTTEFNHGPRISTSSSPAGWKFMRAFERVIDILPNTDYYGLVQYLNGASVVGFVMYELGSMTENFQGYLPQNLAVQGPILDVYREKQRALAKLLWEGGAPKVFNWSTNPGNFPSGAGPAFAFTWKERASSTGVNILDLTSTTVTANTPGWHPDLRLCATLRQAPTGVPCVMKAFGAMSAGTGGNVKLLDSGGAVVAQLNNVFTTTPSWQSIAFNLPATYAKYDVHFGEFPGGGNTFKLWAVSVYPSG